MVKKRSIALLIVFVLTFSTLTGFNQTTKASASEERKPESIVLDFSFFELNPDTDNEKYSEGANQFIEDTADLMQVLLDGYFVDIPQYVACAKALKYLEIAKYLNDNKYVDPFLNYLEKDEKASDVLSDFDLFVKFEDMYVKALSKDGYQYNDLMEMMDEASGMSKSQIMEANEIYQNVIKVCDAALLVIPDLQGAKDLKDKAQKAVEKLMGSGAKDFYCSDVHKNNVGNILFSQNPIAAGKETASQFTSSFTANDNIYAIAYLPMKIKDTGETQTFDGTYICYETVSAESEILVDGKFLAYENFAIPMNIQDYKNNKGYITFELIPNLNNTIGYNLDDWKYVFTHLKEGKHTISITLRLNNAKVASGEFEIDWTNADLKKIEKNFDECFEKAAENRANLRPMPEQFTQKSKKYKDRALSDTNIKKMFMRKFSDATKILKVVNMGSNSKSWGIVYNSLGIPKYKCSTMETWVLYMGNDGWAHVTQVYFKCDYKGGGTYGKPYVVVEMSPAMISPKNVK